MKRIWTIILLTCVFTAELFSQAQMSSGDIRGTVSDVTGAVLPGATVTVTNIETGIERQTTTDAVGNFRILVLPPANYEVKVQLPSFSIYTRRPVQVTVGQT